MRTPNIIYADDVAKWDVATEVGDIWVCARPCSIGGIRFPWRLRLAWYVFTGKYDALVWQGDQ